MKIFLTLTLSLLLAFSVGAAAQTTSSPAGKAGSSGQATRKRGPVFRATKDQIKQAQGILKSRGFYAGEQTGTLDGPTRAGLKEYQKAENIKATGTLNKLTLEKMGITLTERQQAM